MLILLIGAANSGKSRFAETIAARFTGPRIYAATMIPCGAEGAARVDRHRRQRAGQGFVTVECPRGLDGISAGKNALVLLEDVSNLLANEMFGRGRPGAEDEALRQIVSLAGRAAVVIAVTIGGVSGDGCDEPTQNYAAALAHLNEQLAEAADAVIEIRAGTPLLLKGECPWIG